jgi:hypothetical protein
VSSCHLLLVEKRRASVGFKSRPNGRRCVEEAGLRSSEGNAKVVGDLGHTHPEAVAKDQDGALVRRKAPERAVQLIPVMDAQVSVGSGRSVGLQDGDVCREPAASPRFGVAGVDKDPMEPGFEPIELAQRGKLAPNLDERHLYGVFGQVGVAQDSVRNKHALPADLANEGGEGLLVALPGSIHNRS